MKPWNAEDKWIFSNISGGPRSSAPAPFFRKEFWLDRTVSSATLQITALGLYEAEINGQRVGDHVFAPGWTDYKIRVPVQSYNVTGLLRPGNNCIGAVLGDGWFCGYAGWQGRENYGERPELLACLEVLFEDGSALRIGTDKSWCWAAGPVLENDLLMGEVYDARREFGDWSLPGFDASDWLPALSRKKRDIQFDAQPYPPVRRIEERVPVLLGSGIYDMEQNFSGRVRIRVTAPRGTTLTLRHAEVLNPDGSLYLENLRQARATDIYTCKGGGPETWEPRFTFHGFRYVEVRGLTKDAPIEMTGVVLHSDTPPTGSFSCSHPLLNQLQRNITWGQRSNFLEVPTDCPQRDERLGWTGDAQVFVRTAAFNMDVRAFFEKWMRDARDAQRPRGGIPAVIPAGEFTSMEDGGPAWADAMVICPWTIYLCYGDRTILEDNYDAMRKFLEFTTKYSSRNHIRSHPDIDMFHGFGDWLALDGSGHVEGATPKDLIGTAFYANDARIMARVADLLGRPKDAAKFGALHGKIVKAFQRRFVTPDGLLASGTQTSYVLALHFDLLPEPLRPVAARELVRDIERRNFHIATGFVGTPYILDVLTGAGYLDIAYRLLEQDTFPSWLFPVKNGATTIWERWDGWTPDKGFQDKGMNSFNHYAYGAVGDWMYRTVAGLELDELAPGFRQIRFQPRPGGTLTSAQAELITPFGSAAIAWKRNGDHLEVDLLVPDGASAGFSTPPGFTPPDAMEFGAGRHHLRLSSVG